MPAQMAYAKPEQKKHLLDLSSPPMMEGAFLALFPCRDIYIQKLPGQKKWNQNKRLLQDFQILGVIEDGGRGLWRGCYFGELTRFAVLDIDAGSVYHSPQEHQRLTKILAAVNLSGITYGSSESGGWHLYLPLSDWVSSKSIETSLKQFLKMRGYELKGGVLEVFPSGNALRLPLQPGFAFLDQDLEIEARREDLTRDEALKRFLTAFQTNENDWSEAEACINSELARHRDTQEAKHREAISIEGFDQLYDERGKNQERWELGQKLWKEGLLERGQRHDGVLAVGHYLWYGDPERNVPAYPGVKYDRARAKIIETWLEKNHNGHCRHINEGRWDVVREQIARATVWREKTKPVVREPYPLTERLLKRLLEVYKKTGQLWEVDRLKAANETREEEARARIAEAVKWIVENHAPLTISEVARVAGAHRRTVKRNIDLLEVWSSVYITWGVRGGLAASENLTEADQPNSESSDPVLSVELFSSSELGGDSEGGSSSLSASLVVAPLSSCLAQEPTTCTQYQSQALRVPLGALTPGPALRGIQAGTAGCAGGLVLCFPARSVHGDAESSGSGESASPGLLLPFRKALASGVCLFAGTCLLLPRRTEPRPAKPGQIVSFSEEDQSITSAVNDMPVRRLRVLAPPHKPGSGGVLGSCNHCTRHIYKGFEDFDYRRVRGPPPDVIQHE